MKTFRIALLVVLVQIAVARPAQQPVPAAIQGVVVQSGSNNPLGNTRVDLRPAAGGAALEYVTTDRDGRFSFPRVLPGSYRLVASRLGYVNAEYGQRQANGPTLTLTLAAGQSTDNVRLVMSQGGVISGRLTDNGEPVGIADVIALKVVDNNGQFGLVTVLSAKTDDLGEYRIFWLPPGQYYVAAIIYDSANAGGIVISPDGDDASSIFGQRQVLRAVLNRAVGAGAADNEMHIPTFFPGTIDPERAAPIELRAGGEATNINIDAPALPIRFVRGSVTGVPLDAAGKRMPTAVGLVQTSLNSGINPFPQRLTVQAAEDGTFEIPRVLNGSYNLVGVVGNVIGNIPVEVRDGDVNGLVVNMVTGQEVKGRVVIERQTPVTPDPGMASLRVILRPEPNTSQTLGGAVAADGSFKIPGTSTGLGAYPGEYRVLVAPILILRSQQGQVLAPVPTPLQGAYVKSIRLLDRDVLNSGLRIEGPLQDPLEIVIGTNPGSIEGRVMTDRQQPAGAVWVALLPENSLRFRVDHKFTSTDLDGRFQLQGVPPGDYKVYAWEDIERLAWQEPRLMRPYESRGTTVHVDEGRKTTIEFTAIP